MSLKRIRSMLSDGIFRVLSKDDKGNHQGALHDINRAIKLYPEDPEYFFHRASIYNAAGQFDNAITNYSLAIKLRSDFVDAYTNRGSVLCPKQTPEGIAAGF